MASERAHKIDGAVRKLRAVMEAFDMKGTNRATMLNAINTINALNTRPAPAATDTGLASVGEVSTVRESIAAFAGHMLSRQLKPGDLLCLQSQAEELLAAERAEKEEWRQCYHTTHERLLEADQNIHDLKADNAAKDAQIKELNANTDTLMAECHRVSKESGDQFREMRGQTEALEAKLAAAEKFIQFCADGFFVTDDELQGAARAVLGGKPS